MTTEESRKKTGLILLALMALTIMILLSNDKAVEVFAKFQVARFERQHESSSILEVGDWTSTMTDREGRVFLDHKESGFFEILFSNGGVSSFEMWDTKTGVIVAPTIPNTRTKIYFIRNYEGDYLIAFEKQ